MRSAHFVSASLAFAVLAPFSSASAAPPAFRGAEGFAAEVTGGRGGRVIKVTTLAADGPGSLQAALDASGARTIVFEVSGVISRDIFLITHGDLTIAGQTAPGGGITLEGRLWADYEEGIDNIIVRHVRIRPADPRGSVDGEQFDAVRFSLSHQVLLDHVSVSYGIDENVDLYSAQDVTVQWSTIERSDVDGHPEGDHNYGLINGPEGARISVHHVLFAHNRNRNPAIANGPAEIINNIAYDVRHGFIHHNPAQGEFMIVGNSYIRGPASQLVPFYFDDEEPGGTLYHLADNAIDDPDEFVGIVNNPFADTSLHPSFEYLEAGPDQYRATPFDFAGEGAYWRPVTTASSSDAYRDVAACAGAFPRDAVTRSVVQDLTNRTGRWGAVRPDDLMEGLTATAAPADDDNDGIPDINELALGLDPADSSDAARIESDGRSAFEHYLDELADGLVSCTGGSKPPPDSDAGTVEPRDGGAGSVPPDGATNVDGGMADAAHSSNSSSRGCSCRVGERGSVPAAAWGALPAVAFVLLRIRRRLRKRRDNS